MNNARKTPLRLLPFLLITGGATLAGCADSPPPPPEVFAPLDYSFLPPILLHVSNITVQNTYVPDPGAATLIGEDPEAPANALYAMLQHRLVADGTPGNATVTIENASIEPAGANYLGVMTVRLDLTNSTGRKTGYTEASVSVTQATPDSDADQNQVRAALYNLTKQLMDQMNVQVQYQIQHNLGSWVSYTPNASTPALGSGAVSNGGIEATPLPAPTAGPAAPAPLTPGPPGSPPVGSLGTLPVENVPPATAPQQ